MIINLISSGSPSDPLSVQIQSLTFHSLLQVEHIIGVMQGIVNGGDFEHSPTVIHSLSWFQINFTPVQCFVDYFPQCI